MASRIESSAASRAATGCEADDCRPSQPEASLRLTGGRDEYEGNVEIYHEGVWGGVCDDEWDKSEAEIVCRDLGYPGLVMPTHGGKFGHTPAIIWMDNLYCYGTEAGLHKCRFDGWGVHDCDRAEAAGVRCKRPPPPSTTTSTTTPRPRVPMRQSVGSIEVRLAGGRVEDEGRVEVRLEAGDWGVICGDGWGVREAMVACRQAGRGHAAAAVATDVFNRGRDQEAGVTPVLAGVTCRGDEASLLQCDHDEDGWCPGAGLQEGVNILPNSGHSIGHKTLLKWYLIH